MPMVTSHILKSVDFTKAQKSRYLERETLVFLQIKKFLYYTSRTTYGKNVFVAEVTFKDEKFGCVKKLNFSNLVNLLN